MPSIGRVSRRAVVAGAVLGAGRPVLAQQAPIPFVVPVPAGAPIDVVARALANTLAARGHPGFVMDNRAGAAGAIGARYVAQWRSPRPLWLLAPDAVLTAHPALLGAQLGFDPEADFRIVGAVAVTVPLLVVAPNFPARDLAEFVAHTRREEITYASGGMGSAGHLTMELFARVAGLKVQHIPYRSAPQSALDLMAGRVQAAFVIAGGSLGAVRDGRLRALAVGGPARLPHLPDVPTVAESGFPGFDSLGVLFVMLPAAAPPEALAAARAAVRDAAAAPEFLAVVNQQAMVPSDLTPETAPAWIARTRAQWSRLIAEADIKPES
jgi:tripartite-type tricarboxylate transporter receptor subunit TctC